MSRVRPIHMELSINKYSNNDNGFLKDDDYFFSYITFLERNLIPAQMRISNVIHTTAIAKKRNYCQKKEEEMKGRQGSERKGGGGRTEMLSNWYIRLDIMKWSVLWITMWHGMIWD